MAYAKHLQMGVPRDEELKEFVSIEFISWAKTKKKEFAASEPRRQVKRR